MLHAHDYRDACEFAGKVVLIVGASYSAEDIGSQVFFFFLFTNYFHSFFHQ